MTYPEEDSVEDNDLPMYSSNIFADVAGIAAFIGDINHQILLQKREPTAQLGDFVISTHERFTDRGGRRNTGDQLAEVLAMRSIGSGGDMDSFFENGNSTARRLPVACQRFAFRVQRPFRVALPRASGGRRGPAGQQLGFDDMMTLLKGHVATIVATGDPVQLVGISAVQSLLTDEDQIETLRQLYGGSISLIFYKKNWAQGKGTFDIARAHKGEAFWTVDRNSPDSYTHAYRGFLSPPKKWLDDRINRFIEDHPNSRGLKDLLAETKIPTATTHALGHGSLRYYGYNELWHWSFLGLVDKDGKLDESLVPEPYKTNRENWKKSWRLRLFLWWAYEQAYQEYAQEFRHSIEAWKEYIRLSREADESGRSYDYFDQFVQSPPTFQYLAWRMTEDDVQFRNSGKSSRDECQTLEERNQALERILNMLSWVERLPRCWEDGEIHWSWYTHPDHNDQGGHCQGCQHHETWVPAVVYHANPGNYPNWVREESQTWYATRQELQLLRKIIYTHNAGSGNHDISNYGLLSESGIATARNSYMGGGNEAIPPQCWWVPGQTLPRGALVNRKWWLGLIATEADQQIHLPYNSFWLKSFQLKVDIQNSRVKFENLLGLNTTGLGIGIDQLRKELVNVTNYDPLGVVFPTKLGEDPVTDTQGKKFMDFKPELDPSNPKIQLYNDPAFHIDPKWFTNRSLFDPIVVELRIENYELVFGKDYHFVFTWPDGKRGTSENFRSKEFRAYLVSQYLNHKQLLLDFYENQKAEEAAARLREMLIQEVRNGHFDSLRTLINKELEGTPMVSLTINEAGEIEDRGLSAFAKLRSWAYEFADNQWFKSVVIRSRDRGLTWGDITSMVMKGTGQGYGTRQDQLLRIFKYYEVMLKNVYFDTWRGLVEKHKLLRGAATEMGAEALKDFLNDLGSALLSRKLTWRFAYRIAEDEKYFFGKMAVSLWIQENLPKESEEVEDIWIKHLSELSFESNPNGGDLYVTGLEDQLLLLLPVDPEKLKDQSDEARRQSA